MTPAVERRRGYPRYFLPAYALLIIYVSLSPFSGWQAPENSVFYFLFAPQPRYITAFDLVANVLAYAPLGIFLFDLLHRSLGRVVAVIIAAAGGLALSFGMEVLQALLPMRVSSRLDLLANSVGALIGGIFAAALGKTSLVRWLANWRHNTFNQGAGTEFGEMLLAAWLFMQLNPSIPFFAAGTINVPLLSELNSHYGGPTYSLPQELAIALNVCGFGLFTSVLLQSSAKAVRFVLALIVFGALLKLLAAGVLLKQPLMFDWFGKDTLLGIAGGLLTLWLVVRLGHRARIYIAAMMILAGGLLAKVGAIYDTLASTLRVFNWPHGQLFNFTSLTLLVNEFWPLAALIYLLIGFTRLPSSDPRADV